MIYKRTATYARRIQILLGHTKIVSTVRYLGVDVEDALTLAEGTEIERSALGFCVEGLRDQPSSNAPIPVT